MSVSSRYVLIGGEQFRTWETNENQDNYYGRLVVQTDNAIAGYMPVICGHGGSMWLCASCAQALLEHQTKENGDS